MSKELIITYTRYGMCNRRKCEAACCRLLNLESGSFSNDNAIRPSEEQITFVNHQCNFLIAFTPSNDCSIYRNRPSVCNEFPCSPWDLIYLKVKNVCSYWFEIQITEIESVSPVDSPSPDISPSPSPSVEKEISPDPGR